MVGTQIEEIRVAHTTVHSKGMDGLTESGTCFCSMEKRLKEKRTKGKKIKN